MLTPTYTDSSLPLTVRLHPTTSAMVQLEQVTFRLAFPPSSCRPSPVVSPLVAGDDAFAMVQLEQRTLRRGGLDAGRSGRRVS
jgi:hypothetical protein